MHTRSRFLAATAVLMLAAAGARGAETMPLSPAWNVQPSGRAGSSGELLFRMTPADGGDPVEVAVSVLSGSNEIQVARDIRQALAAHLQPDRFDVELGQGANVIVSDRRNRPNFSLELVDSGVRDLRVAVKSVVPVAPPTVPAQAVPATPPASTPPASTPAAPGASRAPANTATPDGAPAATPPPESSSATDAPPPSNSPQTAPPESAPAPNSSANPSPPPEASSPGAPGATGGTTVPAAPGSAPPPR